MSLAGFSKTLARTSVAIGQKFGTVDKTVDKEFEEESRRFLSLEKKTEALYAESKSYLDSIRSMTLTQQRIAQSITAFYDETAVLGLCGLKYKDATDNIDNVIRVDLDNILRITVLEPMQRFIALFPDIHEALKKRNNKALDYDSLRTKVRKLVEKPAADPTKLPQEEAKMLEAKINFETLNQQLKDEIPKLIDARIGYFDPIFEALIKSQLKFYTESYNNVEPLQQYFTEDQGQVQDAERRIQEVLQQMRDLSIVRTSQQMIKA